MTKKSFILYGKNSVFERLKSNSQSIKKLYLETDFNTPHIEKLIKSTNVRTERVSRKVLHKIRPAGPLQGIVAEVEKFEYADFTELLNRAGSKRLSFIFLDRVFDPQNLGAIIRTTACFGGFAIVIPKHKACEVTETVLHVAAGGENFTPVAMVSNLSNALIEAKRCGWWIVGAIVTEGQDIGRVNLPFPLGLVLGSEGRGVRYGIEKHLDVRVQIPMGGAPLSLNINCACSIFCHQIAKQRVSSQRRVGKA